MQKPTVSRLKLVVEAEVSARMPCKIGINHATVFRNLHRHRFFGIEHSRLSSLREHLPALAQSRDLLLL